LIAIHGRVFRRPEAGDRARVGKWVKVACFQLGDGQPIGAAAQSTEARPGPPSRAGSATSRRRWARRQEGGAPRVRAS